MRVMVDADGYAGATDAFRDANHLAVVIGERLDRDLADHASMAGNDATSLEFAATYDVAAREAVFTIADLASAFSGLGRLTIASSRNHRNAEHASTLAGRHADWPVAQDQYAAHRPTNPPTSLGAQEPFLGAVDRWILDHLEGFVWPGASPDRLRAAADTWTTAATSVRSLADSCHTAADALGHLVSPEIPLALDAVCELRALATDTADQLDTLARTCREYADAVAAAHVQARALLAEIAQMIVEGMLLTAAVGAITGGTATAAVAGASLARIAAMSPRFAAILARLAATATDVARAGRMAQTSLVTTRAKLGKFLKVDLRNERGAIRVPGGLARPATTPRPRPLVENAKLRNYVDNLFKGTKNPSRTGDGTTMDAIRSEIRTGEATHGRLHITKGRETLQGLENWMVRNPDAPGPDRAVARRLIDELKDALSE